MASKKKVRKNVVKGVVHVNASFNNTMVTITDVNGETIAWDSAGSVGFKGARKSTPFAASRASEKAAGKARRMGLKEVEVRVKGPGPGANVPTQFVRRGACTTNRSSSSATMASPLPGSPWRAARPKS